MRRLAILVGEGIECEKESRLFFERSRNFSDIRELSVARLLKEASDYTSFLQQGDFLLIPGGFSFSDHFGAGRLLAYQLKNSGVFGLAEQKGWNVFGICNGFQVLSSAGKFGPTTRLMDNKSEGRRIGFQNRWVNLRTTEEFGALPLRLPVRHGEGRLVFEGPLPAGVTSFLTYEDDQFHNGSQDKIAGLRALVGKACYWGMMPHPEIAQMALHDPDVVGAEYFERFRKRVLDLEGDGSKLWNLIFEGSIQS